MRGALARALRQRPGLADTWAGPEPGDVCTPEDLAAAGLDGALNPAHQAEFDQDGVLHTNVPLTPDQKATLLVRQLERDGAATVAAVPRAGWHNAASDYVPQLFADLHGVDVHVVIPGPGELVYPSGAPYTCS
ncbi:hypothetical protein AB0B12_32285 [Streptomyces sp. NPDC044780]|uniref:hypothetical protein n=1 Tax=unclassified Streptomyces TaxID=2593676 RepID=UPI0033FFBA51